MSKDLIIQIKKKIEAKKHNNQTLKELRDDIFTGFKEFLSINSHIFIPYSHFKKEKSESFHHVKQLTPEHIEILKKELQ